MSAPTNPEASFHIHPLSLVGTWLVATPLFNFWARVRIKGKEYVPTDGAMIAVSNHQSMLDPWMVAYVFQRNIRFMGKIELFQHKALAWLLSLYGTIPVDRARRDPQALRTALNVLRANQVLGMFPEGTRSTTGEMQEFHTGAIRLAIKTGAPIVPLGLWGAHRVLPPGSAFPRPGRVTIVVGPPITYPHLTDHHPTPAEVATAADALEQTIAGLIDQARGM